MVALSSRIHLVRAPNPSAMTLSGTNTYIIASGDGQAVCIDPGPLIHAHIDAVRAGIEQLNVHLAAIAVTHGHPDHAPAAAILAGATHAPVYAHSYADFAHGQSLQDNELLHFGNGTLRALDTPGHSFDHLAYYFEEEQALFTGDVILGEGTVVIAPPGGSMRAYQTTLERLAERFSQAQRIYGGHGPPINDPANKFQEYINHRRSREAEIFVALSDQAQTIPELVRRIYSNVNRILWPAAARQVMAYLIALEDEGRVRAIATPQPPTPDEFAILNPSWETMVDAESVAVAQAELGGSINIEHVNRYQLIR